MLNRVLAPFKSECFFNEYWESQPLYISRGEPDWYANLVQPVHVDEIIQLTAANQSADFRVVRSRGKTIESYAVEMDGRGMPAVASLTAAYSEGYTIVVNAVERRWGPISRFAASLTDDIGHPIGINLYLTPKQAQGFQPHVDGHDVFILQLAGEKAWEVYGCPIELPLENQRARFDPDKIGQPIVHTTLTAGDMLYIPRGFVHKGMTSTASSMHLTVGIHARRWVGIMHRAINTMAAKEVDARRSVPVDWPPEQLQAHLESLLKNAASSEIAALALEEHEHVRVSESSSAPGGLFVALDEADDLDLGSAIVRRPGLRFRLEEKDDEVTLHFGQNRLSGPASISQAFEYLTLHESFRVRDLPNSFTDDSKLVLSRRWIREGIVINPSEEKRHGTQEITR